jgi:hypothetical protein
MTVTVPAFREVPAQLHSRVVGHLGNLMQQNIHTGPSFFIS